LHQFAHPCSPSHAGLLERVDIAADIAAVDTVVVVPFAGLVAGCSWEVGFSFVAVHAAWFVVLERVLKEQLVALPPFPRYRSIRIEAPRYQKPFVVCFHCVLLRGVRRLDLNMRAYPSDMFAIWEVG